MSASPAKLRLAFSILLAILTVLVGVVFIGEIADVYFGASEGVSAPYNVEALRSHLIAPFVCLFLWVGAIIAAYVVFELYPQPNRRAAGSDDRTLSLLLKRTPQHGSSDAFIAAKSGMDSMRATRVLVWSVAAAVCVAGAIYVLIYLLDPSHYHPNALHDDAMNLVRHVISWVAASLIACFAAAGVETYAVKRELDFARIAIKTGDRDSLPAPRVARPLSKRTKAILLWSVRGAVAVIAVAFIVAGVQNGGAESVLIKAINICTECIGLG